jgi:hypothetical protein
MNDQPTSVDHQEALDAARLMDEALKAQQPIPIPYGDPLTTALRFALEIIYLNAILDVEREYIGRMLDHYAHKATHPE